MKSKNKRPIIADRQRTARGGCQLSDECGLALVQVHSFQVLCMIIVLIAQNRYHNTILHFTSQGEATRYFDLKCACPHETTTCKFYIHEGGFLANVLKVSYDFTSRTKGWGRESQEQGNVRNDLQFVIGICENQRA